MVDFAGAVLTGGRSSRMGVDKALLELDGEPLALRVASALAEAGADPVMAVGGDLLGLGRAGLVTVADPLQGAGPLSGIATALARVGTADVVVVLACDLVAASAVAIGAVVDALAADPAAMVAVPIAAGHVQTLHAAWRRSALPQVESALAAGDRAVWKVLEALGARQVSGLDPSWFANANDPTSMMRPGLGQTGCMSDSTLPEIDVNELARRGGDGAFVLDVRQLDEYEAGHVPGAVLIPLDQLPVRQGELPSDQSLLVICKSGGRSAAAVQQLCAAGFDATNIAGGTMAWIDAGLPVAEGDAPG